MRDSVRRACMSRIPEARASACGVRAGRRVGALVHGRAALRPWRGARRRRGAGLPVRAPWRGAADGGAHAGGAGGDRCWEDGAAQVVPARPVGHRRDREHLCRRGASPSVASPAFARRARCARSIARRWSRGSWSALEAGLAHGGSSIDDYRDSRGEKGSMQDEFLVHTREGEECPRCGGDDQADRGWRAIDVLLPRLPDAPAAAEEGEAMSEPLAPPAGFRIGHWTDEVGTDGLHGRDRSGGDARRRGRAGRRPGHAGDGRGEPDGRHGSGERGDVRGRERLRAWRPPMVRCGGWRSMGSAIRPRPRWCRSCRRRSLTTWRRGTRRRGRRRSRAMRPARRRARACRSAGRVGAGTGTAAGKVLGQGRGHAVGCRICGGARRLRLDGGGACGGESVRRRDRGRMAPCWRAREAEGATADGGIHRGARSGADRGGARGAQYDAGLRDDGRESLDKTGCTRVARAASAGVARAVEPVFTDVDGDVVFCLASGEGEAAGRFEVLQLACARRRR